MPLVDYLDLLDWTGRQLVPGKRGAIPAHLAPLLDRVGIPAESWLELSLGFGKLFHRVALTWCNPSRFAATPLLMIVFLHGSRCGETFSPHFWERRHVAKPTAVGRGPRGAGAAEAWGFCLGLAWVRELVTMIHRAKNTGAPASRAEELVMQIATCVEGFSEVAAWRDGTPDQQYRM